MYFYKEYALLYTICFCVVEDKVLLMRRKKEPYTNMWNGLGGKIENGETPKEAVIRELMEEADLDGYQADIVYAGVVTWDHFTPENRQGMYAYIFFYGEEVLFDSKDTREGILEWKNLDWVLQGENKAVAENVKYFLPEMLKSKMPMQYHCEYMDKENKKVLTKFTVEELPVDE